MWFILQHWCEWKESRKDQRNTFTFVILHSWFQALFERSLLSLCIHNTKHRVSGSAYWCSKGRRIASTLELLGSSKKAQDQVKIVLLYSRGVKETFPEVASKPCPWACCAMTSRGKLCQLTPWVVQGQRVSTLCSAVLCHFRDRQQISALPAQESNQLFAWRLTCC